MGRARRSVAAAPPVLLPVMVRDHGPRRVPEQPAKSEAEDGTYDMGIACDLVQHGCPFPIRERQCSNPALPSFVPYSAIKRAASARMAAGAAEEIKGLML